MIFLSLVAVLAMVYWTTAASVLQRDQWFVFLIARLRALPAVSTMPLLPMMLALMIPLLVLIVCIGAVVYFFSANFLFFIYVPVLLYSLGRGNFLAEVNHYIDMASRGEGVAAAKWVDDLSGRVVNDPSLADTNDWKSLHTQALKIISYRGFERLFAVLFWFVIAGAVGAFLYRLSVIYREQTAPHSTEAVLAEKWLWLIELPAVRLMSLTWAFVGNFDSCPLRNSFLDTENSSINILNNSLRGALGAPTDLYITPLGTVADVDNSGPMMDNGEPTSEANEESQEMIEDLVGITLNPQAEPAYSFALVKSSVPLYSRSLWFWVGAIAFATLFIGHA